MIRIVNETNYPFYLGLKKLDTGLGDRMDATYGLQLSGYNADEENTGTTICALGSDLEDDVKTNLKKKSGNSDRLKLLPHYTVNFCPAFRSGYINLYDVLYDTVIKDYIWRLDTKAIGLRNKSAYAYVKGLIIIISDTIADTNTNGDCVEDFSKSRVVYATDDSCPTNWVNLCSSTVIDTTLKSGKKLSSKRVLVQIFGYDHRNWSRVENKTYILLPNKNRLLLGQITIDGTDGKEKVINALIRYNEDGTQVVRKPTRKRKKISKKK